ncbi:MAG: glycosyltransferase family 4 protein [Phototrophicaceae bacterium]
MNAHLLTAQEGGYRAAGIHGYIYHSLKHLSQAAPANWEFTAMVGSKNGHGFDGIRMQRALLNTESPMRRIVWEQALQPLQLWQYDLYHSWAFVKPVLHPPMPTVVTVYDLSFIHYPQMLSRSRRTYLQTMTRYACERSTRVLTISESTARDVVANYGIDPSKVDVAPCGTDFSIFRPLHPERLIQFRKKKNLPDVFWLFIGTLEPRKNLPTLLKAYAQLSPENRPLLVIGGGKGWDYDDIFTTVETLGLSNSVRFIGYVPSQELALWYNSASLFIYPSVYEGFGLPVLEAMACGTAVVVADSSSLTEVVEGSDGLRVPPLDVSAWQSALEYACNHDDWRVRAGESGLTVAKRYSWQHTAQAILASYQKAL